MCWTALVTYFCLVNFNDLPTVSAKNFDKIGHLTFHFGLTALWFLYFRFQKRNENRKALLISFGFSFVYGVLLEIVQANFTDTRSGDIADVAANTVGGLIAVLACSVLAKPMKTQTE
ncbi:VanZ family protein [Flavobacterium magnum]|uniref:VanZ family protein n=1 Tax=Flavobacterium magnum TaxID=2162713 RepID=UPI0015E750B0|nr:VanZ family protein [Flavobacterium magnum]